MKTVQMIEELSNPKIDESSEVPTNDFSPDLYRLAGLMGLELEYLDSHGVRQVASRDSVCWVLGAMGCESQDPEGVENSLRRLQQESMGEVLEPVILHYPEKKGSLQLELTLPVDKRAVTSMKLHIQVRDESDHIRTYVRKGSDCKVVEEKVCEGHLFVRVNLRVSCTLPLGYFQVSLRGELKDCVVDGQSLVISAPQRCYIPPSPKKMWGVGVQLYSLRSSKNWGIGDFRDLGDLLKIVGKSWKAATIGLSPIHALTPGLHSPYSPSSRLFWNLLYLNLEEIAEFRSDTKVMKKVRSKKFQTRLEGLRKSSLVNYSEVMAIKSACLEDLFSAFYRKHVRLNTRRAGGFLRFVRAGGSSLLRFCTFQALSERFGTTVWKQWPVEYQDPASAAVQKFQEQKKRRIQYFQYVQWQCELQLGKLDRLATRALMPLRLYYDLPVGIHPDGADAWVFQSQLLHRVTVGAPPDAFNLQGQNWGLQMADPRMLRRHGYQFLRETLKRNMRYGGVLRIDHALGLFRKFVIPQGKTGRDGVYVRMRVDEVLAVLALESHRHKVMIVGEDLGTVTTAIRQKLGEVGLLSYRLLMFERDPEGAYHRPQAYPSQSLVAATTHDLPTMSGFWMGRDIEVKERAGLYSTQSDIERDWESRAEERLQLWAALQREQLGLGEGFPLLLTQETLACMYRFLARTPSRLLMVQLEDLLAQLDTPNLPGALETDYPSWRVKTTRDIREWLKDPAVIQFVQQVAKDRRRRSPRGMPRNMRETWCSV